MRPLLIFVANDGGHFVRVMQMVLVEVELLIQQNDSRRLVRPVPVEELLGTPAGSQCGRQAGCTLSLSSGSEVKHMIYNKELFLNK